jgi:hypothetical protein
VENDEASYSTLLYDICVDMRIEIWVEAYLIDSGVTFKNRSIETRVAAVAVKHTASVVRSDVDVRVLEVTPKVCCYTFVLHEVNIRQMEYRVPHRTQADIHVEIRARRGRRCFRI